jgi:hypothetical protein
MTRSVTIPAIAKIGLALADLSAATLGIGNSCIQAPESIHLTSGDEVSTTAALSLGLPDPQIALDSAFGCHRRNKQAASSFFLPDDEVSTTVALSSGFPDPHKLRSILLWLPSEINELPALFSPPTMKVSTTAT